MSYIIFNFLDLVELFILYTNNDNTSHANVATHNLLSNFYYDVIFIFIVENLVAEQRNTMGDIEQFKVILISVIYYICSWGV